MLLAHKSKQTHRAGKKWNCTRCPLVGCLLEHVLLLLLFRILGRVRVQGPSRASVWSKNSKMATSGENPCGLVQWFYNLDIFQTTHPPQFCARQNKICISFCAPRKYVANRRRKWAKIVGMGAQQGKSSGQVSSSVSTPKASKGVKPIAAPGPKDARLPPTSTNIFTEHNGKSQSRLILPHRAGRWLTGRVNSRPMCVLTLVTHCSLCSSVSHLLTSYPDNLLLIWSLYRDITLDWHLCKKSILIPSVKINLSN
jgi:hypothetical protein